VTKTGRGDQDAAGVVEMPFGRYRGLLLGDVPEDYLKWVLDNNICPVHRAQAGRLRRVVVAAAPEEPARGIG
jgi:uncharacterized protein (DUF3820 family)